MKRKDKEKERGKKEGKRKKRSDEKKREKEKKERTKERIEKKERKRGQNEKERRSHPIYFQRRMKYPCNSYVILLKVNGWKEDEDGEGGESGTVFEDVDLTEKEWADYDERSTD